MTINILNNKATCNKIIANYVNEVYPILRKRLEQGFKTKNDGSFYKKDDDITALVKGIAKKYENTYNDIGANLQHVYFRKSYDELTLVVKARYQTSEFSCDYIDETVYIVNLKSGNFYDFVERSAYTAAELVEKQKELNALVDQYTKLGYEISRLKRELNV